LIAESLTAERYMVDSHFPAPVLTSDELDLWRQRLEWSRARYVSASRLYRRLLGKESGCYPPSRDSELAKAAQAESEARLEFTYLLRVFAELAIDGKPPNRSFSGGEIVHPTRLGPSLADSGEPDCEDAWEPLWPAAFR
jgi:hypothetical protein